MPYSSEKEEPDPEPLKIQVPDAVCGILRIGDTLDALIRPAERAGFWVIVTAVYVPLSVH